jgi:hypothetical protein
MSIKGEKNMSEQYHNYDDLVGGDDDRKIYFKKVNEELETCSAYSTCGYVNTDIAKREIEKTLDEIESIFLICFSDDIKDISNHKEYIRNTLTKTFNSKQPSEIQSDNKNRKIYWNHFSSFVKTKLEKIKLLIPTALILFLNF